MMDEDQEFKFVCKLCFKKYPCGKSLGGHMRSHVVPESDEKLDPIMRKLSSFSGYESNDPRMGELGNGQSSYGLRENPRKSWRAVDSVSDFPSPQGKICKQCGKGFHSLKALCGHMACHSEKDRGLKDDNSWRTIENNNNQKVVIDSHSDTEGEDRVVRTRSCKSKKLKKIVVKSNLTSPVSEIDGEEQEEVAICLMMLSRDCGSNKGGVNSVVESSDNNSVILETKSSSIDTKRDTGIILQHEETQEIKKIGDVNVNSKNCAFDAEEAEMENSDSGYFLDERGKAESDVSVDGLRRNSVFDEFLNGSNKESEYEYGHDRGGGRVEKSRKRRYIADHSDPYNDDYHKMNRNNRPPPIGDTSQKRPKYECFNCKKSFKSYQALGGHRPCHKKSNAFYELRYESGENSLDESTEFATRGKASGKDKKVKAKKSKGHICPFCDRVFKNGQALGGHKRSHFIGGHEVNNNHSQVAKPDLLDLNLPAPQEDDDDDDDDGNEPYSPW